MAEKVLPCPSLLRQLLRYDSETGLLYWRPRCPSMFKSERACNAWNARHANKQAFIGFSSQGYPRGQIHRVTMPAHRVIWAIQYGTWPETIDHIDGCVTNNRLENLRDVTQRDNCRNARRRRDNTSGIPGVRWHKANRKWVAMIGNRYLGIFDDLADAKRARALALQEAGYHANHGRPK